MLYGLAVDRLDGHEKAPACLRQHPEHDRKVSSDMTSVPNTTTQRDELALELFIADNSNQPREQSIGDWKWFEETGKQRGQIEHYENMAAGMIAAGYAKVDHIEYAADHKYSSLEFTDEDGGLFTDRDDFERTFEEYGNATLMQRTVGPWVPLEPEAEATA